MRRIVSTGAEDDCSMRMRTARRVGGVVCSAVVAGLLGGCLAPRDEAVPADFPNAPRAIVQVEAEGEFADPGGVVGESTRTGTGFVLDRSGVVVTTSQVAAGAERLTVTVDGTAREAQLVGSSECMDLAVVRLEDGPRLPFLSWSDGTIQAGRDVWALGLSGDAEEPVGSVRGRASAPPAPADTPWVSVRRAVTFDGEVPAGFSGGPLITSTGSVLGVTVGGEGATTTIHSDEARGVLLDLMAGRKTLGLGLAAQARTADEAQPVNGLWVGAVTPGSAADAAGIEPGDVVVRLGGVALAANGTMAEYCSALRTRGTGVVLPIEVYRSSTGETLGGQVNGQALALPVRLRWDEPVEQPESADLVARVSSEQVVSVNVPVAWTEVDAQYFTDDAGNLVHYVIASPSVQSFTEDWKVSGIGVYASATALANQTVESILDSAATVARESECTLRGERAPFSDAYYTGSYDWWTGCGGVKTEYVVMAAEATDGSHLIWVRLQLADGEHWALEPIVDSVRATLAAAG